MDEKFYNTGFKKYFPYILDFEEGEYSFSVDAANKAVMFIENYCTHVKGKKLIGKPFILEDWQKILIGAIFGWMQTDGLRRFRKVYVELPRKNGKSILAASVALYMLLCDGEGGAEVYSAASTREQAKIVFHMAQQMALANPSIRKQIDTKIKTTIKAPRSFSSYQHVSSDGQAVHGYSAHCVIVDEFHAHKDNSIYEALVTSMGAREQPLVFIITTAGYDRTTACYHEHVYAKKIAEGVSKNPSYLALLFGAAIEDDWTDPKVWEKCNPNLGVSVQKEYLESECREALESPSKENSFKQLYLNIWTSQHSKWLSDQQWVECESDISIDDYVGKDCYVGVDLASTTDLTAMVVVFPEKDGSYAVFPTFWLPEDTIKIRSNQDKVPYFDWHTQGLVRTTQGEIVDYEFIRKDILKIAEKFKVKEVAIDRFNAQSMMTKLMDDGIEVVAFSQTPASMSPACKELEKLVLRRELKHDGNEILRWNMSNIQLRRDSNDNIKIDKGKSQEKVDGAVAMVMALGRAIANSQQPELIHPTVTFI